MIRGTLIRLIGASGTLRIIAPWPASDMIELPLILIAITLTKTSEPHAKLNGAAFNAKLLIVQLTAAITEAEAPLHNEVCSV